MIVIFVERMEDFVKFLERRVMNEIFYDVRGPPDHPDKGGASYTILLHFLGAIGNAQGLYETEITLNQVSSRDELIEKMKLAFQSFEIELIEGKIREVFMSLS